MSSTAFYKGQQLGRNDLNIFLTNVNGTPENAAEISYALYDFTTGREALLGLPQRMPANPSMGEYFASIIIPLDANIGEYRIRWTFREMPGAPIQQVLMGFSVIDKVNPNTIEPMLTPAEHDLGRRLRIMLRDNSPDRNYRFRPPAHEATIEQFNRVFGFIWEDGELKEYLERSLDEIISSPPQTPFSSIDAMVAMKPQWRTLLITGATVFAIQAVRLNWVADEFSISGSTLVRVLLPDGREVDLPVQELHAIIYGST